MSASHKTAKMVELSNLRLRCAVSLVRRVDKVASLTLKRDEVIAIAMLLGVQFRDAAPNRPKNAYADRDRAIALYFHALTPDAPRPRGWKTKLKAELAKQFYCEPRTVERCLAQYLPEIEATLSNN